MIAVCEDGMHLFYPPTFSSAEIEAILLDALECNREGGET